MMINLTYRKVLALFLKVAFFGICAFFITKFFLHPEHWSNAEVKLLFTLEMLAVAFPASIIVWIVIGTIGKLSSALPFWQYFELFFFFAAIVLIGYWQWFILLPKIWIRLWGKKGQEHIVSE